MDFEKGFWLSDVRARYNSKIEWGFGGKWDNGPYVFKIDQWSRDYAYWLYIVTPDLVPYRIRPIIAIPVRHTKIDIKDWWKFNKSKRLIHSPKEPGGDKGIS